MALRISIEKAEHLSEGIWKARLSLEELRFLSALDPIQLGDVSVLLTLDPDIDEDTGEVRLDPSGVQVLHIGESNESILITRRSGADRVGTPLTPPTTAQPQGRSPDRTPAEQSSQAEKRAEPPRPPAPPGTPPQPERRPHALSPDGPAIRSRYGAVIDSGTSGDRMFLDALSPGLRRVGARLLDEVRQTFNGELRYNDNSRKYIETPTGFWSVAVPPDGAALHLTVRGRPKDHRATRGIVLKPAPDLPGHSTFSLGSLEYVQAAAAVVKQASSLAVANG